MNKNVFPKLALIFIVMLFATAACDLVPQQLLPPAGGGEQPAPGTPTANDAQPVTIFPAATESPVLMCTPPACAPGETLACPSGDCPGGCGTVCTAASATDETLPPVPADWEGLEDWLASAWRANVNPAAVRAALQQSGWQESMDDWRAADFDGDLLDEWILVLYDRSIAPAAFGPAGDLWVVNGNGPIFRYYIAPSNDIFAFIAPRILSLVDMTGDGRPELITNSSTCGANTCYDSFRVVGWADGQLRDLQSAQPPPDDAIGAAPIVMSYADTRFADLTGNGLPDLLIHGGLLGSVGAGVVRARTEVWGWDGSAVTLAQTILDPTDYRHHILYEANDLMDSGDLGGALPLYEAAINDPALRNDGFFLHTPEQIYADISAFSAFRLILIDLMQGNIERANSRLSWLTETYPASAAAGAAATLVGSWSGPANAAALCDEIEVELMALDNPTGALADMGYGNPTLGAVNFCPSMADG